MAGNAAASVLAHAQGRAALASVMMTDLLQLRDRRPRHRRDLRSGGDRLHAAVADLADHQFRAGRVRDGAGLLRAGRHDSGCGLPFSPAPWCWRSLVSMLLLGVVFRYAVVGPLIRQRRAAAGHLDHRARHPPQGVGQGLLQRRGAALPDPAARLASITAAARRHGVAGADRRAGVALVTIGLLQWFLAGTRTGRQMQATAQNPDRGAHPRRAGRAHDPLHLPDQRGLGGDGVDPDLADLSRPSSPTARRSGWSPSWRRSSAASTRCAAPSPAACWSACSTISPPPTSRPPTARPSR